MIPKWLDGFGKCSIPTIYFIWLTKIWTAAPQVKPSTSWSESQTANKPACRKPSITYFKACKEYKTEFWSLAISFYISILFLFCSLFLVLTQDRSSKNAFLVVHFISSQIPSACFDEANFARESLGDRNDSRISPGFIKIESTLRNVIEKPSNDSTLHEWLISQNSISTG